MTNGTPILEKVNGHKANGKKPRIELAEAFAKVERQKRSINARYDASLALQDTANHWALADSYDSDAANSRGVRDKLVQRSRYEIWNNGYADGITQTYATDLIGVGPQLRMQTGSTGFNQLVERAWFSWCQAIQFRRKLWCTAHAKHSDGEGLGIVRRNQGISDPVKLDWVLYETEQCQSPRLYLVPGKIDGIQFDAFGNPQSYDFLKYHPGSTFAFANIPLEVDEVSARYVTHWFRLRRPGQHRGIPESTSTLNLGAAARRWRESTLTKAEMQAKLTVLLESLMAPSDEDADPVAALSSLELMPGTMTALPNTVKPNQLAMDTPGAQYEAFHKSLINEQARPKSMPYNKAACDSSSYNYASGRLDHQTYYDAIDVDRADCNDAVLNKLFENWFEIAVLTYGWLGGNPLAISAGARAHTWDWPKHHAVDIVAEATANDLKLKNGSTSIDTLYTEDGLDYEDEVQKQATSNGITVEQQRKINLLLTIPPRSLPFVAQVLGLEQPQASVAVATANAAEDAATDTGGGNAKV